MNATITRRLCDNCDRPLDAQDEGQLDCRRCRIPEPKFEAGFDAYMEWVSIVGYEDEEPRELDAEECAHIMQTHFNGGR